jgi:hypothetical protein
MTITEILAAADRIGKELSDLAHLLGHLDLKTVESVSDRALLLRLQRCAHDTATSFKLALPR